MLPHGSSRKSLVDFYMAGFVAYQTEADGEEARSSLQTGPDPISSGRRVRIASVAARGNALILLARFQKKADEK